MYTKGATPRLLTIASIHWKVELRDVAIHREHSRENNQNRVHEHYIDTDRLINQWSEKHGHCNQNARCDVCCTWSNAVNKNGVSEKAQNAGYNDKKRKGESYSMFRSVES